MSIYKPKINQEIMEHARKPRVHPNLNLPAIKEFQGAHWWRTGAADWILHAWNYGRFLQAAPHVSGTGFSLDFGARVCVCASFFPDEGINKTVISYSSRKRSSSCSSVIPRTLLLATFGGFFSTDDRHISFFPTWNKKKNKWNVKNETFCKTILSWKVCCG